MKEIIQKTKNLYNKEKKVFWLTIVTSLITHFQLYTLMITGADTLINNMYHRADIWEAMLLRFGLDFMQMIKGNIVSPVLVTIISSILLGITVILVTETLKIKNKYFKYITAMIFAVAPNISATLTFFYCSDAYIIGMLLSTLAVFLMQKYKDKKWPILLSGLFIALAMGMYQTYLSITMVLCLATLLIDSLENKDKKQIFKDIIRYLLMGIIGIIIFYILSHLTLLLKNLKVSDYSGASSIGLKTLLDLPKLLPEAYKSFFNYYFTDKMIPNTIWGTNILYIIIFTTMIISLINIIIKNKTKTINIILAIIFIIIAPICFGVIEIMVPDVDIHILMACAMIYIIPIFFKILEIYNQNSASRIFKYIVAFCSLIIIWNYIWQDNASYLAIKSMQNQAESTVTRIVTQIEELDEYTPNMPVLFLGGLENNSYLSRENTSIEAKKIFDRSWGFISKKSTIFWGNLDSRRKMLYEHIGVNLNLVSEWECQEIFKTEEYKNMKYYPEKDSIKIINNTVVVKLSD